MDASRQPSPIRRMAALLGVLTVAASLLMIAPGRPAQGDPPPNPSNGQINTAKAQKAALADQVGKLSAQLADLQQQVADLQAKAELAEQKLADALQKLAVAKAAVSAAQARSRAAQPIAPTAANNMAPKTTAIARRRLFRRKNFFSR